MNIITLAFALLWCSGQKGYVTSILVVDVIGNSHSFTFAPHGMVFDLKSHINSKFNITSDVYWLSNKGKPLQHDFVPLQEISAGQCYNEWAFNWRCKMLPLRVCNKQYSSLASGGPKPAKGKTQSKTRSDAYHGILKVNPCIVQCSQSKKNVCLSSDIPCLKHNINVFNSFTLFSVACNFLDETYGSKTDFHHHLYQARDSNDKSQVNYICTSCQPFFLKSVKIEDEYKKAHAMFEKTQKSANPSILTADPVIEAKSKAGSITSTQASGEPEATFELLAH